MAVETPTVKPALSSKYMVGKTAVYFQNYFKNWSKFIRVFSFKNTSVSFDETMLVTGAVQHSPVATGGVLEGLALPNKALRPPKVKYETL